MLTSTTDYEYVDWENPILNDAESPRGKIMPTEDQLSIGHALRYEDFCYLYESLRQLYYGGWNNLTYITPYNIMPSLSGQYQLRSMLGYLSGDWVQKFDQHLGMKPLLTKMNSLQSTEWIYAGSDTDARCIYTAITNYIPNSEIVDCSGIDIELEEKPIEDQLMMKMYDILEQVRIVNVPTSYCRIDQNSSYVPALGLWNFTGTYHYQSYNEQGQLTADNTQNVDVNSGYAYHGNGAPIVPGLGVDGICNKTYHWQTKITASRRFMGNSSLKVKVPSGTTQCWFYVSAQVRGASDAYVKMMQASVDAQTSTATVSGLGTENDLETLLSYIGDNNSMTLFLYLTGVFCKVNAKWHWW